MKKKLLYTIILCFTMTFSHAIQEDNGLWSKINVEDLNGNLWERGEQPLDAKFFGMDILRMEQLLDQANSRFDTNKTGVLITVPNPSGAYSTFEIYKAPVLHEDLQIKYPEIGSLSGFNIDRPSEKIRLSRSFKGLNFIVLKFRKYTFSHPVPFHTNMISQDVSCL